MKWVIIYRGMLIGCLLGLGSIALWLLSEFLRLNTPHEGAALNVSKPLVFTPLSYPEGGVLESPPKPFVRVAGQVVCSTSKAPAHIKNRSDRYFMGQLLPVADDRMEYHARMEILRKVGCSPNSNSMTMLMSFVSDDVSKYSKLRPIEIYALKNMALDIVLREDVLPDSLGFILIEAFLNRNNDTVWRDYCLQHLSLYYMKRWVPDRDIFSDDETRLAIQASLRAGASEYESTISGTALLGMKCLADGGFEEFTLSEVANTALAIVGRESACECSRVTAMRTLGGMSNDAVLLTARIEAQTGDSEFMRLSAVSTLGEVGGLEDRELIASMAAIGGAHHVMVVVTSSIARIDERLGNIN